MWNRVVTRSVAELTDDLYLSESFYYFIYACILRHAISDRQYIIVSVFLGTVVPRMVAHVAVAKK